MMAHDVDLFYMQEALRLAQTPLQAPHPNPRVGCVIVSATGQVVGRGWHEAKGQPHAERVALEQAGSKAVGATLYTTLEPCVHQGLTPPCVEPVIKAQVARVVMAMLDPNPLVKGKGLKALERHGIRVQVGLCEQEAAALNRGFIARHTRCRPWIRAKVGMSLDGRIALKNGQSQWITCAQSRQDVHKWRAQSDVILTGVGTILADDPLLTVRKDGMAVHRQPLRVVMDRQGRMPSTAKLLKESGETWIVDSSLPALLQRLQQAEFQEVWVEAGPTLLSSLWKEQLIDEWVLYVAPMFLGDAARSPLLAELSTLTQAVSLHWRSAMRVGDCYRFILGAEL